MSKPRYPWWGYARNIIRAYPARKKEYENLHEPSVTANMSGMPGGGGVSRGTEDIAIRELTCTKQREYDAVKKAIALTAQMPNGALRLKIIGDVFWKNERNLRDAGDFVGYEYKTARNIQSTFIKLVGAMYPFDLVEQDKKHIDKLLKTPNWCSKSQ